MQNTMPTGGGSTHAAPKILSSTSKDLIAEVRAGRFREDLYYRLNVYPIAIPALNRRKEDIPQLVRMFCEVFCSEQRKLRLFSVNAEAMAILTHFDWPGNIRQLENAIYRAVTLSDGPDLTEADFPQISAQMYEGARYHERSSRPELVISNSERPHAAGNHRITLMGDDNLAMKVSGMPNLSHGPSEKGAISSINERGELRPLAEVEEELIRFALGFYRGQMSQVARKLGIGRSTLYRKLKDYGIDPDDPLRDVA